MMWDRSTTFIACLEAITCGKLTIVSDSKFAATKDFAIDNKCIFKHNNYKNLSAKIDYFIENPIEKEKYEKLYLDSSSKYNQNECMNKMVEMFETTIKNNKWKRPAFTGLFIIDVLWYELP